MSVRLAFLCSLQAYAMTRWLINAACWRTFFLLLDFVDADLLELAFFELLPDDFFVEDLLPLECLPFVPLCLPDPGSARGLAGGTGSFQLNASIWLPT